MSFRQNMNCCDSYQEEIVHFMKQMRKATIEAANKALEKKKIFEEKRAIYERESKQIQAQIRCATEVTSGRFQKMRFDCDDGCDLPIFDPTRVFERCNQEMEFMKRKLEALAEGINEAEQEYKEALRCENCARNHLEQSEDLYKQYKRNRRYC